MTEDSNELLADFVDEAVGSLQGLPVLLNAHREQPDATDSINAVFRAVHSIKGCAGFLGLTAIKTFAHSLENTLDDVRKKKITLDEPLQRDFVQGFDLIEELLSAALDGAGGAEMGPREAELLEHIAQLTSEGSSATTTEDSLLEAVAQLAEEMAQAELPEAKAWGQRITTLVAQFQGSLDAADAEAGQPPPSRTPQSFVASRFQHGQEDFGQLVLAVLQLFIDVQSTPFDDVQGVAFLESARALSTWAASREKTQLREALEKATRDFQKIVDSPLDVDAHILSIVWDEIWPSLEGLEARPEATRDDTPHESIAAASSAVAASASATAESSAGGVKSRMVRIKEERLDEFLNHVSSLFITGELYKDLHSRFSAAHQQSPLADEMRQINGTLRSQSTALQQSIVALRRVSVAGLFSKFPRMARGLAQQLGKQVDVNLSGEDTEIDKTLAEDLDAPLTHMVRNVVDHAIETPEERKRRGVDEIGNLWLHAEQTRTHVRITVRDDGRGIDPVRLRNKSVEKGLLSRAQADSLADREAIDLIFHAGFSTAEKISDVSGRGVGMDVVRTTLREHGGDVTVESKVNIGTTFVLEIPIRTAVLVIDGLMLSQSNQSFVVPFEHILEITEIAPADLKPVQGARVAVIRGNTYDAVRLADVLNLQSSEPAPGEKFQAILVGCKHGALCLLVDRVFGHRQVVVNSINEILPGKDRIAGVAQLGGGHLALVLSVPDVVKGLCRPATV